MKLRGPRSALHGWQDARQRQRAKAAAERRAWRKVYEDFAFRVHGHVMFEERLLNKSATVWAPCADWLFVLVGTYLPETQDEGGGRPARWITSATLHYESAARGRRGKDTPLGDTGEFSGRRARPRRGAGESPDGIRSGRCTSTKTEKRLI